ncbi:MAG: heme-binding protein, partial [Verrucomicrobiales bacterium]|nr:heme-binding protein [Verrucomicrobiales bacterium]
RAEGKGRDFGPDLTGLGRRHNRGQILGQILRPSKHIHPGYVLQLVGLKKGEPVSGFIRHRDKEGILLRDAALKEHQIPFTNIKSIRPSKLSAMPVGIIQNLTAQEAADLVEYLRSLR